MINATTGYTPFRLVFGREMKLPIHLAVPQPLRKHYSTDEWVKHLDGQLEILHRLARKHIGTAQLKQKRATDIKRYEKRYNVGDYVYKLNTSVIPGRSKKLNKKFTGPYMIVTAKTSAGNDVTHPLYAIRSHRNKDSIIHHDRLILASDRVALPFWLQRQRKKVLQDMDKSIEYERRRFRRHKPPAQRCKPYITHQTPESAGTSTEVTGPDKSLAPEAPGETSALLPPPTSVECEHTSPTPLAHMKNSDLDDTIPADSEEIGVDEDMYPNPSTSAEPGLVENPQNALVHASWTPTLIHPPRRNARSRRAPVKLNL